MPRWKDNKPPEDVNTSDEETAVFKCGVEGIPRPTVEWMLNKRPLEGNERPMRNKGRLVDD